MMLTETGVVTAGALPVEAFKDHLRLGTGFADDGFQDALVETYLRASIAAICLTMLLCVLNCLLLTSSPKCSLT